MASCHFQTHHFNCLLRFDIPCSLIVRSSATVGTLPYHISLCFYYLCCGINGLKYFYLVAVPRGGGSYAPESIGLQIVGKSDVLVGEEGSCVRDLVVEQFSVLLDASQSPAGLRIVQEIRVVNVVFWK